MPHEGSSIAIHWDPLGLTLSLNLIYHTMALRLKDDIKF